MNEHHETTQPPHALTAADWRKIVAQSSVLFEVISDSMRPVFTKGECIRIRPLEKDEPRVGQVVAFLNGIILVHRYLGRGRYRGDNTLTIDRDVELDAVIGIVVSVSRDGQEVPILRKTQWGMVLNYLHLKLSMFTRTSAR